MKVAGTMIRREEIEFFLRLHGLWEGIIALPPPPASALRHRDDGAARRPAALGLERRDRTAARGLVAWRRASLAGAGTPARRWQVLVLDADDPFPADEWPVYRED